MGLTDDISSFKNWRALIRNVLWNVRGEKLIIFYKIWVSLKKFSTLNGKERDVSKIWFPIEFYEANKNSIFNVEKSRHRGTPRNESKKILCMEEQFPCNTRES